MPHVDGGSRSGDASRMTMLDAMPERAAMEQPSLVGSHPIEFEGRSAIVRGVELFTTVEDAPLLGTVDLDMLQRIVEFTNELAGRGRHPNLVIQHNLDGDRDDDTARGRIENVRLVEGGDRPYIVGDLRIAAHDAEWLIDRYPRRSAEIQMLDRKPEGRLWLKNVALLGRESPGADLPDVLLFSDDAPVATVASSLPEVAFAAERNTKMGTKEIKAALAEMSDDDRKKLLAEFMEDGSDDEKKKDDEDQSDNADPKANANTSTAADSAPVASFDAASDPTVAALMVTVGQMKAALTEERIGRRLEKMREQGVQFELEDEAKYLGTLSEEAREAHFARMETNYQRKPTGAGLVDASSRTAMLAQNSTGADTAEFSAHDADRVSTLAQRMIARGDASDPMQAMAAAAKELGLAEKAKRAGVSI
jgi:hypothetical protein